MDVFEAIKKRYSCRAYKDDSIEIEKLGKAGNLDAIPPQIDLLREIQEGFKEKTTS